MIRKLLPPKLKLQLRLLQRHFSDRKNRLKFAETNSSNTFGSLSKIKVYQKIKRTSLFENKVHNLQLAAGKIAAVAVQPGEVFSFWRIVGNPSVKKGYKTGRNIVNGKLQEATGGGLCQLSGIVYHTALLAGLQVTERFNHTVDIYREEDRFTPLGADATVVYGYKDLRIRNTGASAIRFVFAFEDLSGEAVIRCTIESTAELQPRNLVFQRTEIVGGREVVTTNENGEQLAVSRYRLP